MKHLFFYLMTIGLLATSKLSACTGIKCMAQDGTTVHGRTLEFGVEVDTSIVFIPKGYSFSGNTPKGDGKKYQSKYAMLGTMAFSNLAILDGINEEGLAIGTFYFPGYAAYTPTTDENQKQSLSPLDFPNWILSQFSSLQDIKNGLKDVIISPTVYPSWGNIVPPFHYVVFEKSGASIVIEPIDGQLMVYDNPLGVLTNSPTFDWHMTNLCNYINLTPYNAKAVTYNGMTFTPFGQGSGMVGLPGDFTPPSRFVRAVAFSQAAISVQTTNEAIFQTFHILNQFDIPKGIARQAKNELTGYDYTMITVVRDPYHLKYYFKTYEDQIINVVEMQSFDKNSNHAVSFNTKGEKMTINSIPTMNFQPLN